MIWLIRLYPAKWRKAHGNELEQLVHDLQPSRSTTAIAVDLIKGALDVHLQRRFDVRPNDRRAIKRGALIAGIFWLGLSVEVFLSNVVFPSKTDNDTASVLISYLCVFAALFLTGLLAARDGTGRRGQVLAGAIAGMLIGSLTIATFSVVDNLWLDVVAQQQAKIDGFAHSNAGSMREFINQGLVGAAVFLTIALGVIGAALSLAGGLFDTEPRRQLPIPRNPAKRPPRDQGR